MTVTPFAMPRPDPQLSREEFGKEGVAQSGESARSQQPCSDALETWAYSLFKFVNQLGGRHHHMYASQRVARDCVEHGTVRVLL